VINILFGKRNSYSDMVREFNEGNIPSETIPSEPTAEHSVLGPDANLPLIVKDLAPIQLDNIRTERMKLQKRLNEIDKYEKVLLDLLDVVK